MQDLYDQPLYILRPACSSWNPGFFVVVGVVLLCVLRGGGQQVSEYTRASAATNRAAHKRTRSKTAPTTRSKKRLLPCRTLRVRYRPLFQLALRTLLLSSMEPCSEATITRTRFVQAQEAKTPCRRDPSQTLTLSPQPRDLLETLP